MARAANQPTKIITESDPEDGDDVQPSRVENPGIPEHLTPPAPPQLRSVTPPNRKDDGMDFDVVEVDDAGKPLKGQDRDEDGDPEDRGREANFSDEEGGDRPLLDRARGDREPRRSRRERQRQARERQAKENDDLKAEIRRLRARVDGLDEGTESRLARVEDRFSKDTATKLEADAKAAADRLDTSKKALARAIREGDEDAVANALQERDEAFVGKLTAEGARDEYKRRTAGARDRGDDDGGDADADDSRQDRGDRGQQRRGGPVRLSARAQSNVEDFMSEHSWFDPDGKDEDSQMLIFLDAQVKRAGFKPEDEDYWDELEKRGAKFLPHRFSDQDDDEDGEREETRRPTARRQVNGNGNGDDRESKRQAAPPTRRGPMTSGSESRPSNGARRVEVRLTPARKDALIQAGVIDSRGQILDSDKYKRTLKKFAEFDTENRANGAR